MIIKIRKIIALNISLLLMIFSFGLIKPNVSGLPTVSNSTDSNKCVISISNINKNTKTEAFPADETALD